MAFNMDREDHQAVVSEEDIKKAVTDETKLTLVDKILESLNEKRDAHNGIIVSMIYIIKTGDSFMIQSLISKLIEAISAAPMKYSGKMFISKVHIRLMKEMPLFVEDLFEHIILKDYICSKNFASDLSTQIIALKAIRMAEQHPKGRPTLIPQEVIEKLCEAAIRGSNDETKVDTISLMLECRTTTKPLEQRELNLFRIVYRDSLSFSEPSLRQVILSGTNKLIKRIKDSYKAVVRYTKLYPEEEREQIYNRYMDFLQWIIEFSFDSIYCNAYHGSFIITINTLKYIIKHVTYTDQDLPILQFLNKKHCYESLLTCINDSFEHNKTLSLELILMLPHNDKFISERNLESFEKIAYQLVDSINPAHSLSCIYMFKLLIGLNSRIEGAKLNKNQQLLHNLTLLVDQVESSIIETRQNFVSALNRKPIYSKLSCIRALLNDVELKMVEEDRAGWESLTRKIVTCAIDACGAISNVVCNLNPETIGHLPMDLKPIGANTLAETLKVKVELSEENVNTISSQMLLIAGWKTIKECSLSLGSICERLWWPTRKEDESFTTRESEPILSYDLIVRIIDFFEHYLRNLRHRGAFEQAYYGFTMVTRQVWKDERYKNLLIQILEKIMDDFKTENLDEKKEECLKAYVTRRSAGLPFIIQAILNSEYRHESRTLRWVMDNLFELLESKETEEYKRIHCLNILRALIREHCLGEKVGSYIGKTFIVTLESFKSDSFSIRNCASMLLKAVVDRTFGVNRLREDIHRHNQLPFARFFENCPNLHKVMLELLIDSVRDEKSLATIHAIFIVLFRLRPCIVPGLKEANEELIKPFLEPVKELALNCRDYKLRELAAKLYARLESFISKGLDSLQLALDVMFPKKKENEVQLMEGDMNRLHGNLLLIKYQLELGRIDETRYCRSIELGIKEILNLKQLPSAIKLTALDIVETYCINNVQQGRTFTSYLFPFIENWLKLDQLSEPMFENLVFKAITTYLMSMIRCHSDKSETWCILDSELKQLLNLMRDIIVRKPNFVFSVNLQASLIRFIRQITQPIDSFVDHLMNNLDLDYAAALVTPFDKLDQKLENDAEKDKLAKYCTLVDLPIYLRAFLDLNNTGEEELFKLSHCSEFNLEEDSEFSLKNINTPRAIELMAYLCKEHIYSSTNWISFKDLIQFINRLPECDLKCLMLLHGGQLMDEQLSKLDYEFSIKSEDSATSEVSEDAAVGRQESVDLRSLDTYCLVLDELADGDNCTNTRETCVEVLRMNFEEFEDKRDIPRRCLKNLLSALIKLSQDEERSVRQSSLSVMVSLEKLLPATHKISNSYTIISPLENLIKLITGKWFNPTEVQDCNDCFELLMRIIFNHSKNYSNDFNEEKEHLFDRTKLNNFSDHVSTIESSLEGLRIFFNKRVDENGQAKLISLSSLEIPDYVRQELKVVDSATSDDTGDYSWRLKKIKEQTQSQHLTDNQKTTNDELVDDAIECILVSMDYFSNKYWNMLIDTDYTYHELSFFKRIVFLKFILECTNHNLKKKHLVSNIRDSLIQLTEESCCTTLLKKCLNLMT